MKKIFSLLVVLTIGGAYAQSPSQNKSQLFQPSVIQTNGTAIGAVDWLTNTLSETEAEAAGTKDRAPLSDAAFAAQLSRDARSGAFLFSEPKPNEVTIGRFNYSGIVVEIAKMPNRLQLLNPFAPPEYGSGELNLVREPSQGRPVGLKLFAIHP